MKPYIVSYEQLQNEVWRSNEGLIITLPFPTYNKSAADDFENIYIEIYIYQKPESLHKR